MLTIGTSIADIALLPTHVLAAAGDPTAHVRDQILIGTRDFPILTMHMVTLTVAAGLLIWLLMTAARAIAPGPEGEGNERYITKGRFAQMIEAMIEYLRDEMLKPVLGDRATRQYMPFLLTLFFFILVNNVFGLVPLADLQHLFHLEALFGGALPIGGTATGNISVTAGLAIIAGILIVVHGLRDLGPKEFFFHMCGGLLPAPTAQVLMLSPVIAIVFVIEVLGLLIKPTALAIRLFANMVAGHVLLAVLLGFGYMAASGGMSVLGWGSVSLLTGGAAVLIFFLEVFVAFLQAFIFMFLTAVFISLLTHHGDHEHEHDEHGASAEHGPEPTAIEQQPQAAGA